MKIDMNQLVVFLVRAKTQTYAGDGKEIDPQRPGFRELEFREGDFEYRDSYAGFFFAPGQEVVRFRGEPIWAMAYSGGMHSKYHGNREFALQTFGFLKEALKRVDVSRPFRGTEFFDNGDWMYRDASQGDITDFIGTEHILHKGHEVFRQHYIGGLIVSQ